jgi:hypothetical protein
MQVAEEVAEEDESDELAEVGETRSLGSASLDTRKRPKPGPGGAEEEEAGESDAESHGDGGGNWDEEEQRDGIAFMQGLDAGANTQHGNRSDDDFQAVAGEGRYNEASGKHRVSTV